MPTILDWTGRRAMTSEAPSEPERTEGEGEQSAPRASRKRPAIDVAPYSLDLLQCATPVSWAEVFGNGHPVELEVGSGKGLFLAGAAAANPGHNYLGIELAKKY